MHLATNSVGPYNRGYFQNPLRARYSLTDELKRLVVRLPQSARVLDLGCGDLRVLTQIAELRADLQLHGVDVGEIPESAARGGIQFTQADVTSFAPATEHQLVIAVDVLEHLPRPDELIRTAWRALADAGFFYTTVPSVTKLLLFGDENFYSDYSHVRPFSCKSVSRLLCDHGFKLETVATAGHGRRSPLRLFYYLARGLATLNPRYLNAAVRMIGGTTIEAVATKARPS